MDSFGSAGHQVRPRKAEGLIELLFLGALLLWTQQSSALAGQFWENRPYSQWTEIQVLKLLTDSPWARTWTAARSSPPTSNAIPEKAADAGLTNQHQTCCETLGSGVGDAASDPRTAPQPSAPANPPVFGPMPYYRVLWASSQRVRQALYRLNQLNGAPRDAAAEEALNEASEHIIIAISGRSMERFAKASLSTLKPSTWLRSRMRGSRQVGLLAYVSPADRRDQMALFVFPRNHEDGPTVEPDDEEIEFRTGEGADQISVVFQLRQMAVKKKLDF